MANEVFHDAVLRCCSYRNCGDLNAAFIAAADCLGPLLRQSKSGFPPNNVIISHLAADPAYYKGLLVLFVGILRRTLAGTTGTASHAIALRRRLLGVFHDLASRPSQESDSTGRICALALIRSGTLACYCDLLHAAVRATSSAYQQDSRDRAVVIAASAALLGEVVSLIRVLTAEHIEEVDSKLRSGPFLDLASWLAQDLALFPEATRQLSALMLRFSQALRPRQIRFSSSPAPSPDPDPNLQPCLLYLLSSHLVALCSALDGKQQKYGLPDVMLGMQAPTTAPAADLPAAGSSAEAAAAPDSEAQTAPLPLFRPDGRPFVGFSQASGPGQVPGQQGGGQQPVVSGQLALAALDVWTREAAWASAEASYMVPYVASKSCKEFVLSRSGMVYKGMKQNELGLNDLALSIPRLIKEHNEVLSRIKQLEMEIDEGNITKGTNAKQRRSARKCLLELRAAGQKLQALREQCKVSSTVLQAKALLDGNRSDAAGVRRDVESMHAIFCPPYNAPATHELCMRLLDVGLAAWTRCVFVTPSNITALDSAAPTASSATAAAASIQTPASTCQLASRISAPAASLPTARRGSEEEQGPTEGRAGRNPAMTPSGPAEPRHPPSPPQLADSPLEPWPQGPQAEPQPQAEPSKPHPAPPSAVVSAAEAPLLVHAALRCDRVTMLAALWRRMATQPRESTQPQAHEQLLSGKYTEGEYQLLVKPAMSPGVTARLTSWWRVLLRAAALAALPADANAASFAAPAADAPSVEAACREVLEWVWSCLAGGHCLDSPWGTGNANCSGCDGDNDSGGGAAPPSSGTGGPPHGAFALDMAASAVSAHVASRAGRSTGPRLPRSPSPDARAALAAGWPDCVALLLVKAQLPVPLQPPPSQEPNSRPSPLEPQQEQHHPQNGFACRLPSYFRAIQGWADAWGQVLAFAPPGKDVEAVEAVVDAAADLLERCTSAAAAAEGTPQVAATGTAGRHNEVGGGSGGAVGQEQQRQQGPWKQQQEQWLAAGMVVALRLLDPLPLRWLEEVADLGPEAQGGQGGLETRQAAAEGEGVQDGGCSGAAGTACSAPAGSTSTSPTTSAERAAQLAQLDKLLRYSATRLLPALSKAIRHMAACCRADASSHHPAPGGEHRVPPGAGSRGSEGSGSGGAGAASLAPPTAEAATSEACCIRELLSAAVSKALGWTEFILRSCTARRVAEVGDSAYQLPRNVAEAEAVAGGSVPTAVPAAGSTEHRDAAHMQQQLLRDTDVVALLGVALDLLLRDPPSQQSPPGGRSAGDPRVSSRTREELLEASHQALTAMARANPAGLKAAFATSTPSSANMGTHAADSDAKRIDCGSSSGSGSPQASAAEQQATALSWARVSQLLGPEGLRPRPKLLASLRLLVEGKGEEEEDVDVTQGSAEEGSGST